MHPLIRARRSSYAFDSRALSRDQIRTLFEAARWGPSSFNEQPWRFLIATRDDPAAYARIAAVMSDWNRVFAERAPLIGLTAAKLTFAKNGAPNRHAFHDVGLASQNLSIQAVAMGLQTFFVAGFDVVAAKALIDPSDDWEPAAMFVIGYPGRVEDLPEALRAKEARARTRHALGAIVFDREWGKPFSSE
ncbi:MAG: nitroreductase family protein [bacterium]